MLSDGGVDLWMDTMAGVMAVVVISGLSGIGVDVLVDVNVNVFAVMTVKFVMPVPSGEFSCWAAFDCRPIAALDCCRVLQARIPSYHV